MKISQRAFAFWGFVLEAIAIVYFIAFLVSFDSAISMLNANADGIVPDLLRSAWQWIGIAGFSHLAAALLRMLRDRSALAGTAPNSERQNSTAHNSTVQYPEQPAQ